MEYDIWTVCAGLSGRGSCPQLGGEGLVLPASLFCFLILSFGWKRHFGNIVNS